MTDATDHATRNRRLLLAKQLHAHALDHSGYGSVLDKMIAVHNFHNAVEITLRAIALEHEVRVERELAERRAPPHGPELARGRL